MVVMSLFAIIMYAVRPIAIPRGMTVDIEHSGQKLTSSDGAPSALSISRRGTVALIVRPRELRAAPGSEIVLVRRDGSQTILALPSTNVLAQELNVSMTGSQEGRGYASYHFLGVAIGVDESIFATVGKVFSGAFSGFEQDVFIWSDEHWGPRARSASAAEAGLNFSIGGVDSTRRFSMNFDYGREITDIDAEENDPHYHESGAILIDEGRASSIGHGIISAMAGIFTVGRTPGYVPLTSSPVRREVNEAVIWRGKDRMSLGPGVAFGVNASGEAVGSSGRVSGISYPTLWSRGRAVRLSNRPGTAYAISRNGSIVGTVGDDAFLVLGADSRHKMLRIDALLQEVGWKITAAYGISDNGRILAIGRRRASSSSEIIILDPVGV